MIAIHHSEAGFHPHWVDYCKQNNIPYKRVDALASDLAEQMKGCDALMWHHSQTNPQHLLVARQILFALQHAGKVVFPDYNTSWHFDDKVGQKYLLELLDLPLVKTYLFFDKREALEWVEKTSFPKVFKLRRGAGSLNVRLIRNKTGARRLIHKAFGRGFGNYYAWGVIRERWRKWRLGKASFYDVMAGVHHLFIPPEFARVAGRAFGYAYFQDFIPGNDCDIRVIVIGDKAFAIKRKVRKNDFRASGSGQIFYDRHHINENAVRLAFEVHGKLNSQCTAMDIIFSGDEPRITEISFGFVKEVYADCPGYWDRGLGWHEGPFDPYGWMVELVFGQINH